LVRSVRMGKIREVCRGIYVFLMGILLLWYLYSIATFVNDYHTPGWVKIARCTAAVMAVWLGELWKDRGFRFLAAFWTLLFLRVGIPQYGALLWDEKVQESLLLGVWLFGACFRLPKVMKQEELKKFLLILFSIWMAGMAVYSAVGIYAAWTDSKIYTIGGTGYWNLRDNRLNLVFYFTTAASLLCLSSMIAVGMMCCLKKIWAKILFIPPLILMLVAMSLTDSRTARILFSIGMGGMACVGLVRGLRKAGKKEAACWTAGILGFGITAAGLVVLLGQVTPLFNTIRIRGGLIPAALAEGEGEQVTLIASRGLSGLTDREEIWGATLQYLKQNPKYLLTGTSIHNAMAGPNSLASIRTYTHCHNILLQTLLESGIPGLALLGGFIITTAGRGIRLICKREEKRAEKKPLWAILAAVIVFAMWVGEMDECLIVLLRHYTPMQALVFIGMGIVCAYGQREKSAERAAR